MKRMLLMTLACLVMVVTQAHAAYITEDDAVWGDSLNTAWAVNTTDIDSDSNFTAGNIPGYDSGLISPFWAVINGSYGMSARQGGYDFYKLTLGRPTAADFSLRGFDGKLVIWGLLGDGSWKSLSASNGKNGFADVAFEKIAKGVYVVGVAGDNAHYNSGGFTNTGTTSGSYQLGITLDPIANPEPSAFLLTGLGLLGLFGARKKFSRSQAA